ncbi:LexA family protein [Francisella sp. TX07-6608]|uniref:LexA family protein n=1 Tax=Francisella sp. TX07-6608 TaxID=573568 RepID=UPI0008F99623|nr:LexA family transcriptional regulator [Francisella sp. TX07-6608]OIN85020.1 helix-turn-helix family protein [Francisella sp. TX07-6608]
MFIYGRDLGPLLIEKGLKRKELAERLNINIRTIHGYIAGKYAPTYERHIGIMNILGLEDNYYPKDNQVIPIIDVPVLSYVQAGEFTESIESLDSIDFLKVPKELVPKNGFSLKVQGDSMLYDISESQILHSKYAKYTLSEGENILIDPNELSPQNLIDKLVVARNLDGATVKLLYRENNKLCLMPLNSKYQNNENIKTPDAASIIGKVVTSINIRNF